MEEVAEKGLVEVKEVMAEKVVLEELFFQHIVSILKDEIWRMDNLVEYYMIQYRDQTSL